MNGSYRAALVKNLFSIYPHVVWQVFFRHALPNFFAIHTVLLQKFVCA